MKRTNKRIAMMALIVMLMLSVMSVFSSNVKATSETPVENVAKIGSTEYATLAEAVTAAKSGETITLIDNVALTAELNIVDGKNVVLDLNGKTISYNGSTIIAGSLIMVHNGGTLTVNDSSADKSGKIIPGDKVYGAIQVTKKANYDESKTAKLTINGGTITGQYYGIVGNGSRKNTDITINGGTISGTWGIFHPQVGNITINGGTIKGTTGIEMRAGELVVDGGTIIGDATEVESKSNGSGTSVSGAAIGVSQHTTAENLSITINKGTVKGFAALYQCNPEGRDEEDIKKVSIEVSGGTLETMNNGTQVVFSENLTGFVKGGTYSTEVDSKYVKDGYVVTEVSGKYKVVENVIPDVPELDTTDNKTIEVGVAKEDTAKVEETIKATAEKDEKVKEAVEAGKVITVGVDVDKVAEKDVDVADAKLINGILKDNEKVAQFFDISVFVNADGQFLTNLTELSEKITLAITVPDDLWAQGRTFYFYQVHDGVVSRLNTKTEGKVVYVEVDKFSTYALGYEDVDVGELEEDPEVPQTGDIMLEVWVGIIAVAAVGLVFTFKRNKK